MGVAKAVFSGAFSDPPKGLFSKASGFFPEEAHFVVFKAFSYLDIYR